MSASACASASAADGATTWRRAGALRGGTGSLSFSGGCSAAVSSDHEAEYRTGTIAHYREGQF